VDLTFIADTLNAAIDPGTRILTLKADVPFGPPIAEIFEKYLNGGPLLLTDTSVTMLTQPDRVLLTGSGNSFPLFGQQVRAYFTVDGSDAVLDLIANPAGDWDLGVSFPVLADTGLTKLVFSTVSFTVRSSNASVTPHGMFITGVLQVTGYIAFLTALLNGATELLVEGAVEPSGDIPKFRLTEASSTQLAKIGGFLPMHARIVAGAEPDGEGGVTVELMLQGVLTYVQNGQDRTIAFGVDLINIVPTLYRFVADTSEADLGIRELVQLVSGAEIGGALPPVFSVLDNFVFTEWEISVGINPISLSYASLTVASRKPWNIIANLLDIEIEALKLFAVFSGGSIGLGCQLTALLSLDQPTDLAVVTINAKYPGFQISGALTEGEIDVRWMVRKYLGAGAADILPDKLKIVALYLAADPPSATFSFYTEIDLTWPIDIGVASFTVEKLKLGINRIAQGTGGLIGGDFRLGTIVPEVRVDVTAAYKPGEGWLFDGGLKDTSTLSLSQIIASYLPDWDLSAFDITLLALRVSFSPRGDSSKYHIMTDARWDIAIGSFTPSIRTTVDIRYDGAKPVDKYAGFVRGTVDIGGFELLAEVRFPKNELLLKFGELSVLIETQPKTKLTIKFPDKSLGDVIAMLVSAAVGEDYTLPAPWSILNLINLKDFTLIIYPDTKDIGLVYSPTPPVNLGFGSITSFELWYTGSSTGNPSVDLKIVGGSFLGQKIDPADPVKMDVLNPASAPKVPGQGDTLLSIPFLGMGQRVTLKSPATFKSVSDALDKLEKAFKDNGQGGTSPIAGTELVPSEAANWLFGIRAVILGAITIKAVFLDPELYGISVSIAGDKFPKLTGLDFEILYKKVNDSIGVYQIQLKPPDFLRQLEFGAVTITLPIIGVEIFTNGDFRIDLGFPRNGDFTRSFGIQVLPFTGSGGLYFGVLSSATAKRVPATTKGSFDPVVELGIGLQVGLGKNIDKGILKAGLSLTLVGIVEGALAFYNPNDPKDVQDAVYYYLTGDFSLVGQIYGEIDFAIISARLEVLITIGVFLIMEAAEPITFGFFAQIKVSLTVKINLGLFKISLSFGFEASIRESFTIGSVGKKPWASLPEMPQRRRLSTRLDAFSADEDAVLVFHPVVAETPIEIPLLFVPQFTPSSEIKDGLPEASKAQAVASLYIATSAGMAQAGGTAFDDLVTGVLLWTLSAYFQPEQKETPVADVLGHPVSIDDLTEICKDLARPGLSIPFDETQLVAFFEKYLEFKVSVAKEGADGDDQAVSVFPMLSAITLRLPSGEEIDFATHQTVSAQYLRVVKDYFKPMLVDFLTPEEKALNASVMSEPTAAERSLAAWIMLDYFTLLAKGVSQAALDTLTSMTYTVKDGDTLSGIAAQFPAGGLTPQSIVRANAARTLRSGSALAVPAVRHRVLSGEDAHAVAARYGLDPGVRLTDTDSDWLTIEGITHRVNGAAGDTLLGIARYHGVSLDDIADINAERTDIFPAGRNILLPFVEAMTVKDLIAKMEADGRFENVGGSATRSLLNGLRPPSPTGSALAGLYELNGQQFDASELVADQEFRLVADILEWLKFEAPVPPPSDREPDPLKQELPYKISASDELTIKAFTGASLAVKVESLTALPAYETRPQSFALGNAVIWRPAAPQSLANGSRGRLASGDLSIWAIPATLQAIISDPNVHLPVNIIEKIQDAPHEPPYSVAGLTAEPDYSWAATIPITIRQVSAPGGGALPGVYEMSGASVAGSSILQKLLTETADGSDPIAELSVLYSPDPLEDPSGRMLLSQSASKLFLIQTNLSTAANPTFAMAGAALTAMGGSGTVGMTPLELLRLVWEGSVVRSGGYYLYYHDQKAATGLPAYLFNGTDEASITLLVTYSNTDNVLRPYMDSLVVNKDIDISTTLFYLEAADGSLVEDVSTMLPGCIGFEAVRTPPVSTALLQSQVTSEAAQPFIGELFNLLNFQVVPFDKFKESPFAPAVSPAESPQSDPDPNRSLRPTMTSDVWRYQGTIPIYRFLAPEAGEGSSVLSLPDPADNPYRGIGGTAAVGITWLDIFGNRITDAGTPLRLEIPVRYSDSLIPLDKWPNVASDYLVDKAVKPQLSLRLRFSTAIYGEEDGIKRAYADCATFQLIYFQLSQPGVSVTVTSTLDSVAHDSTAAFIDFAGKAYTYLNGLIGGSAAVADIEKVVLLDVADTASGQYYQLITSVQIARPESQIQADLSAQVASPIKQVASTVPPRYDADEDEPATLRDFALRLETAFPNLAVAVSSARETQDDAALVKDVWVVRFGGANGISYEFSAEPRYWAPLPLAVTLQAVNTWIYSYKKNTPIQDGNPQQQSFVGVDMDLQAQAVLEAIDLFLSPQFVVPGWLAENTATPAEEADLPIQRILKAKKAIAAAAAAKIAPVLMGGSFTEAACKAAVQKIEQQLLIKLSDLSTIDSIVQFDAAVTSAFDTPSTAPRVFGKPNVVKSDAAVKVDETQDYTFSTADVSLANVKDSSFMTFLFGTRDPAAARNVAVPMAYQRTHLQYDFSTIPGIPDYTASSWLSFVTLSDFVPAVAANIASRDGVSELGDLVIPVPLRAYPPSPILVEQSGESSPPLPDGGAAIAATAPIESPSLDDAKRWDFTYEYQYAAADQDAIYSTVILNSPVDNPVNALADPGKPNLLEAILQFTLVQGDLWRDLESALINAPDPALALVTMESLAWLVERIAAAWPAWPPKMQSFAALPETIQVDLKLSQEKVSVVGVDYDVYGVKVTVLSAGTDYRPEVELPGWNTAKHAEDATGITYIFENGGKYLPYSDGGDITRRTVRFKRLDVLKEQNGWAGVSVHRNERLVDGKDTNSDFVYQTPLVQFSNVLTPLLQPQTRIDIAQSLPVPPATDKLYEYLRAFLRDFFDAATLGDSVGGQIKLVGSFAYPLAPDSGDMSFPIDLPIFLTPPFDIQVKSGTADPVDLDVFTRGLADFIMGWFGDRKLTGRIGELRLQLSLFAGRTERPLPLLELDNLYLETELIWN